MLETIDSHTANSDVRQHFGDGPLQLRPGNQQCKSDEQYAPQDTDKGPENIQPQQTEADLPSRPDAASTHIHKSIHAIE